MWNYSRLHLTLLFLLAITFGILWGMQLGLTTPAWAAGETCPSGQAAPCAEDIQLNGCTQCHSIQVVGGNRNGTDRIISASSGSNRHINDPRSTDWTSNVNSMISKGAPADLALTSGYLNTNYCTGCSAAILGSPSAGGITETAATITWSTSANGFEDEPTDTVLFYGTNQADVLLGSGCSACTTISDSTPVAHHVVNLTGLTVGTTYYLVNQATSSRGTVKSSYAVPFKTKKPVTGGIPSLVYFTGTGPGTNIATFTGVIDPTTNTQIATIRGTTDASSAGPGDIAPSPDGASVYALEGRLTGNLNLDVIDVPTNTRTGAVVSAGKNFVVVSPNGQKVYVTQSGQINVIDTSSNTVVDTIPVPGTNNVCQGNRVGLGIHPSGSPLYIACTTSGSRSSSGTGTFYLVNPVTKVVTQTYSASSYSLGTSSAVSYFEINHLVVKPDGTRVYAQWAHNSFNDVIEVFDGATGARLSTITLPTTGSSSIVVSPDGTRLYAGTKAGVHVIDTATNSILTTIAQSFTDFAVTPDGKRLYATNYAAGASIYVIDLVTNTVGPPIPISGGITQALAITVSPGRAGAAAPDLVMDSLTSNGASADVGQTLSVSDTVKNQGPASTGGSFTIAYHLSPTANYDDPGAVVVPTIRSVGTLAAGASDTITTSLLIPGTVAPGSYYVCAKADSVDDIAENNETNNTLCSTSRVQINQPDLIMTQELPQASAVQVGQTLLVTDTVQNQGGASTGSSFTIAYHLSPTANYDDSNAKAIPTIRAVGTLAAGASDTASRALLIPGTVAPGSYYVCAKADPADTVSETNENNNTRCSDLTVSVQ